MNLANLSAIQIVEGLKNKQFSATQLVEYYLSNIEKNKHKNAVLEVFEDCLDKAREVDQILASGKTDLPKLFGVPIIIKDNILYKGKVASCASKFMQNYVAQYNSTVVQKLLDAGVIILGRANMDEFAMGGSCENSAYGACLNALDDTRVSGGSSGGSAVAVAADMCAFALGSDTGGSVRQPASFNGVIGIKPTYARVSRFGLVAYASSFDQIGPITKTIEDSALVMSIIAGHDANDETSLPHPVPDYLANMNLDVKNLKIGILKETQTLAAQTPYAKVYENIISWFKAQGATVIEVTAPLFDLCLPTYYTLTTAEATSNLGRFDGVKYTTRAEGVQDLDNLYLKSRTQGFGKEVKRRIMLGNFVLSSGFYDAYYMKAMKVRTALKQNFAVIFKQCDVVMLPTAFGEAFKIGSKTANPVDMYVEDMFTTLAPIVGLPAISVPCGKGENGLPLGLQIMANHLDEEKLFATANHFLKNFKEGQ
ncbi:MAG: Asp-tRNA(Asn)/Glu-tRNA(Gln) amidotransferase subunit GatA [Clostridia bacterium]|nr:Asp-tRNA(Asn)/Glu-tRNA(Gln) amidotransferase subunit GatA [Clostridia bacterium]